MKKTTIIKTAAAVLAASLTTSIAGISASARTLVFRGDFDMDGVLTSSDALTVLHLSSYTYEKSIVLMSRMDIDKDGQLTSSDAVSILRDSVDIEKIAQSRSADDPYTVNDGLNDFSDQVFKRSYEAGKNTLVSPLSLYTALAMLENGAKDGTKSEMLNVLGGGSVSAEEINEYMNGYISTVNGGNILNTANAMYVMDRPDVEIKESFVNEIKRDYFAEVFKEPANDLTVDKINGWVKTNTKGMIDSVIGKGSLTKDTAALLLNAVSFDAKWESKYEDDDIRPRDFTNYDGSKVTTDFLYSTESNYISDDLCQGFVKPYETPAGEDYAFVAILPNEGISVDEYIACMNDSTIRQLVDTREKYTECYAAIPKFRFDSTYNMNDTLKDMGMELAFDKELANFKDFAAPNAYIKDVIQKTFIELDENGTKAAAVTVIEMDAPTSVAGPDKMVYLDRPFIFSIYDMKNKVPVFIGTLCETEGEPVNY